ncbi:hypothetical protein NKH77_49365 [Streptomyces sp. M19]
MAVKIVIGHRLGRDRPSLTAYEGGRRARAHPRPGADMKVGDVMAAEARRSASPSVAAAGRSGHRQGQVRARHRVRDALRAGRDHGGRAG